MVKHIGDVNIEDSGMPLTLIATDATTGEKVVLDKVTVADAVMESTCITGIFVPVEKDN
ncbi:MAG: NTE family protein [Cyclobacteriaceae bacterium]